MAKDDKVKIVFLDASTLARGDVSFNQFTDRWECEFFPLTKPEELPARIAGKQIAVTNKVVFDAGVMSRPEAADLKLIAVAATGTNNVDLDAARQRGIAVCNVSGYSTDSVAQHTIGMMIELASRVGAYHRDVCAGAWENSPIFTVLDRPVVELAGKTLGIVGLGAIGGAVAKAARGLGMEVLVSARPGSHGPVPERRVALDEMLARADVLSLHCPLTPETDNLIDAKAISKMKSSAFIINVARGGIVNEKDLVDALRDEKIAGAATDVLAVEPPPAGQILIEAARELDNLIITPHTAWASVESRRRLMDGVAANIEAFLNGEKRNRIV